MKKSILLLCGGYRDISSANGVCNRNLVEEFVNKGYDVWVITSSNKLILNPQLVNGVHVYCIGRSIHSDSIMKCQNKGGFIGKLQYFIVRLFWGLLSIISYPRNIDRRIVNKMISLSKKLINDNNISYVLSTSFPYDTVEAGITLKKNYGNSIKFITYHYDLMFYPNNTNKIAYQYKRLRFKFFFKKELEYANRILLPESCIEEFSSDKIVKTGLPVYITDKTELVPNIQFQEQYINIVYVGTLDTSNRDPKQVLMILKVLSSKLPKPIKLHIWGNIIGGALQSDLLTSPIVVYHGKIDSCYVSNLYSKSDFVLNVGNKVLYNLIPSKIFQCFASGKPIINIVQHSNDCSVKYFNEYENTIFVRTYNTIDYDALAYSIETKISNKFCISIDKFDRFTPSFISNLILMD